MARFTPKLLMDHFISSYFLTNTPASARIFLEKLLSVAMMFFVYYTIIYNKQTEKLLQFQLKENKMTNKASQYIT